MGNVVADGTVKVALKAHIAKIREFEGYPANPDAVKEVVKGVLGKRPSIQLLKEIVSEYVDDYERIFNDDIPATLAEYGVSKVTMDDGVEVGTEDFVETKQVDAAAACAWLESVGAADLIKDSVAFGKGMFDERLRSFLEMNHYSYTKESGVHGQTLKKFIKERLEHGLDLPPADAIMVKPYTRAKIKFPKSGF